jgi:hypothetical protein
MEQAVEFEKYLRHPAIAFKRPATCVPSYKRTIFTAAKLVKSAGLPADGRVASAYARLAAAAS